MPAGIWLLPEVSRGAGDAVVFSPNSLVWVSTLRDGVLISHCYTATQGPFSRLNKTQPAFHYLHGQHQIGMMTFSGSPPIEAASFYWQPQLFPSGKLDAFLKGLFDD